MRRRSGPFPLWRRHCRGSQSRQTQSVTTGAASYYSRLAHGGHQYMAKLEVRPGASDQQSRDQLTNKETNKVLANKVAIQYAAISRPSHWGHGLACSRNTYKRQCARSWQQRFRRRRSPSRPDRAELVRGLGLWVIVACRVRSRDSELKKRCFFPPGRAIAPTGSDGLSWTHTLSVIFALTEAILCRSTH